MFVVVPPFCLSNSQLKVKNRPLPLLVLLCYGGLVVDGRLQAKAGYAELRSHDCHAQAVSVLKVLDNAVLDFTY